jgi:hypothetical protein
MNEFTVFRADRSVNGTMRKPFHAGCSKARKIVAEKLDKCSPKLEFLTLPGAAERPWKEVNE